MNNGKCGEDGSRNALTLNLRSCFMNLKKFDYEAVLMKENMLNQMVCRMLDVVAGGNGKLCYYR